MAKAAKKPEKTEAEKLLLDEIKAAGIEYDHHESDLYLPGTAEARAILARYPTHAKIATTFIDQRTGTPWIDVPFAYFGEG